LIETKKEGIDRYRWMPESRPAGNRARNEEGMEEPSSTTERSD
jgi:hypothetical protein